MADSAGKLLPAPSRHSRVFGFSRRHPWLSLLVLLVAAALILRLGFGWHVSRQLAAQQEEMRRRGEPVDAWELTIEPLPDDQNAWVLLGRAAARVSPSAPGNADIMYAQYPPFGAAWDQAAKASEQANAAVFPLARQARGRQRSQLRKDYPSPLFTGAFGRLGGARDLAVTLLDGAMYRHLNGDDPEAIERVLDTLHLARSFQQDEPAVSQLIAMGFSVQACHRVMMIAPGLRADSPQTRSGALALIAALLDDEQAAEGFRRSFVFERLFATDYHRWQSAGAWALRPLAEYEMVQANADAALYAEAARAANAVDAQRAIAATRRKEIKPDEWGTLFNADPDVHVPRYSHWYSPAMPRLHRYVEERFRDQAERRAAAVSLAARLYNADHGRWPRRLEELAPDYLPAVPADPFRTDGGPLGYVVLKGGLPDGKDRPLVFYEDGGVVEGAIDAEPMYYRYYGEAVGRPRTDLRQYRDLARWLPTTRRFDEWQQQAQAARPLQPQTAPSSRPATRPSP